MTRLDRSEIRLGFVALTDCAPVVIAKERGFFRRHGVRVVLERQASWASVRDKLAAGVLDGAQTLAPMPLAASLGLDGVEVPMTVPMALGLNGNAVTVSRDLFARLTERAGGALESRAVTGHALRALIEADRRAGRPRLRFAVVYPFSPHCYELLYWMAAAGVHPLRDVELSVIPPVSMVPCLGEGRIDGFCVGEPWSQLAAATGVGCPLISKYDIWNNSPEKVLAVTSAWAEENPDELCALVRAIIEAAAWIDRPEHRLETVHVIAGESHVDAPVGVLAAAMHGEPRFGAGTPTGIPDFHVFHRYAATFPWVSHAAWFLTQMLRWGQIEKPIEVRQEAARVYRPDLYREAAEEIGEPVPEIDEKMEGVHASPWTLHGPSGGIAMGPDRFVDGRAFSADDVVGYLEGFEVSALRVRLDDLALHAGLRG